MSTSPFFFKAFLGTNGRPAASGWLFAYAAGSTTPKPIFSDRNNTIPLANPLRLDGNGVAPQFFTEAGLYDFKVFEYNFVTPDEPGPSCFTAEDIDGETGGGGGSPYVLPIATETILGGVKPDGVTTFVDEVTGVISVGSSEEKTICVVVGENAHAQIISLAPNANGNPEVLAQVDLPAGFFNNHSRLSLSVLVSSQNSPTPVGNLMFIGYLGVVGSEVSVFGTSPTGTNVVGTAPVKCELFADSATGLISSQATATQDGFTDNSNKSVGQPFDFSQPLRFSLRGMHLSASSLSVTVWPHVFTTYEDTAAIVGAGSYGQELVLYARNNSGVNILDGQCVYITGASGNKCTIALADSDNSTASHIIAVATQDINNNADGYVTLAGRVNDIDTSAFAEGAEVWLGDVPGSLVSTIPSGANVRARVGYIIRSHATQGALEVSINRYPFFSELSGNGVTTRTTTSATSAPTRFVRYTGTGGHTEPLPTATTISADRYYRNSGTGPWTITANGGDLIDPGNPAALVSSVTLLPGQTLHIYVALTGLWEAF